LQGLFHEFDLRHRFLRLQRGGRFLDDDNASVGSLNFQPTETLVVWIRTTMEVFLCLQRYAGGPYEEIRILRLLDDDPTSVVRELAKVRVSFVVYGRGLCFPCLLIHILIEVLKIPTHNPTRSVYA
jgi:hypothetical protein